MEERYRSSKFWSSVKSSETNYLCRVTWGELSYLWNPTMSISKFVYNSKMPWRIIKHLRWHLTSSNPLLWQRFEFHIDFCLKGILRAYLNKEHFRNRMWHSINAYTSEPPILLWMLSCSVATGNNAAHFAWCPQERALLWKTTIEESLQVPRESVTGFCSTCCCLCSILEDGMKLRRSQWALRREAASKPTTH